MKPKMDFAKLTKLVDNVVGFIAVAGAVAVGLTVAEHTIPPCTANAVVPSSAEFIFQCLASLAATIASTIATFIAGCAAAVAVNLGLKAALPKGHPRKHLKHMLIGGKAEDI